MKSLCLTPNTENVLEENTFEMFLNVSLSTLNMTFKSKTNKWNRIQLEAPETINRQNQ